MRQKQEKKGVSQGLSWIKDIDDDFVKTFNLVKNKFIRMILRFIHPPHVIVRRKVYLHNFTGDDVNFEYIA